MWITAAALWTLSHSVSDVCCCLIWESGRGEGGAGSALPEVLQADPGPAVSHHYGARAGGAEKLHRQRQVNPMARMEKQNAYHCKTHQILPRSFCFLCLK